MKWTRRTLTVLVMILCATVFVGSTQAEMSGSKKHTAKSDMKQVDRGRYLTIIGGCNDCHTPGYLLNEGKIPEKVWLTGDKFGWRGPWGTTYAANLRTFAAPLTEDQWVAMARKLRTRPPMPWFALNIMHDEDLKAIYQFIRYMGPAGEPAPAYVPPDQEPKTPYALFPSPPKEGHQ
jgi:mono/diheme cytochrome c family protein